MVWLAMKLRFEASGRVVPDGYTVTKPSCWVWVTVTFIMTAETPEPGTPPRPVTCSDTVPNAGTAVVVGTPLALRVSRIRDGGRVTKAPGTGGSQSNRIWIPSAAGGIPKTSVIASASAVPGEWQPA